MNLKELSSEIIAMRKAIEQMQAYLMEDEFEVSDKVITEVEKARKSKGISHEDVVKEFCK